MATSRIKGITIELNGDTTPLAKSLTNVNKNVRSLQTELRDVEKLLKLDPGNTELLKQKYELLGRQITEVSTKLEALKQAEKQVEAEFNKGNIGIDEYNRLKREIIDTEQKLNGLKTAASSVDAELASINTNGLRDVQTQANKAENSIKSMGDAAKTAGSKMKNFGTVSAGVVASIGGAAEASRDWSVQTGSLERNAERSGKSLDKMYDHMYDLSAITGDTGAAVESLNNILALDINTKQFDDVTNALMGVRDMFGETFQMESVADSLFETLATGEATGAFLELLDKLKVDTESFNGKLKEAATDAEKMDVALAVLSENGLTVMGETVRKENEGLAEWERLKGNILALLANLAEAFTPVFVKINEFIENYLMPLTQWLADNSTLVSVLLAVILGLKGITAVFGAIKSLSGLIGGIGGAAGTATGKIGTLLTKMGSLITKAGSSSFTKALAFLGGGGVLAATSAVGALGAIVSKYMSDPDYYYEKSQDAFSQIQTSSRLKGRARGGIVHDGSTLVGEEGPELLTTIMGRTIVEPLVQGNRTTNNNSNVALGGVNVNVYGAPGQNINELAELISQTIAETANRKSAVFK